MDQATLRSRATLMGQEIPKTSGDSLSSEGAL
jgi:hypothetical protein